MRLVIGIVVVAWLVVGAVAAAQGIKAYREGDLEVRTLQSYFGPRA